MGACECRLQRVFRVAALAASGVTQLASKARAAIAPHARALAGAKLAPAPPTSKLDARRRGGPAAHALACLSRTRAIFVTTVVQVACRNTQVVGLGIGLVLGLGLKR